MVAGICGIGLTGAGAVNDLLKEYDDIQGGMEDEFTLLYIPDGILDLEYHLVKQPERFFSSDIALRRFEDYVKKVAGEPHGYYNRWTNYRFYEISMRYIKSITQMKWRGAWQFDSYMCPEMVRNIKYRILDQRILSPLQYHLKKKIITFLDRDMYLSIRPDFFYEKTKRYLKELFTVMGYDTNGKIFVNQLFAGNNPEAGMQFFDHAKAIVVERDPRDIYLSQKNGRSVVHHWSPTDTVESFADYYRYCRNGADYSSKNVLLIHFEDLIYQYEDTVRKIENFLGIYKHVRKKAFFNPAVSIQNTQLFAGNSAVKKETAYIEKHLAGYLYDFTGYEKRKPAAKT